jgi:hypothetical protein
MFTKEERKFKGIDICKDCHSHLHSQYSHAELAKEYNDLSLILAAEAIARFIKWVAKQRKHAKR